MKRVPSYKALVFAFMTSIVPPAFAQDPVITYTYPDNIDLAGGQRVKTLSCGTLKKEFDRDRGKTLKLTCEFAEALDANNQKFCNNNSDIPPTYWAFRHYGTVHGMCKSQLGQIETLARQNEISSNKNLTPDQKQQAFVNIPGQINQLLGEGWLSETQCPLLEARDMCAAEMGR